MARIIISMTHNTISTIMIILSGVMYCRIGDFRDCTTGKDASVEESGIISTGTSRLFSLKSKGFLRPNHHLSWVIKILLININQRMYFLQVVRGFLQMKPKLHLDKNSYNRKITHISIVAKGEFLAVLNGVLS